MRLLRRYYGAGPLHLLSLLACFAFAGYVVTIIHAVGDWQRILIWFGGAIVGHDLVLFPLYALADRSAGWLGARRHPERFPGIAWINYVRVPVVMSGLLLAICFPLVLGLANPSYHAATGLTVAPYAGRYLFVVAVLFATSAVLYAQRVGRAIRRRALSRPPSPAPPTAT